jgi:hypothetical protein
MSGIGAKPASLRCVVHISFPDSCKRFSWPILRVSDAREKRTERDEFQPKRGEESISALQPPAVMVKLAHQ